jgi:hypothetical protein
MQGNNANITVVTGKLKAFIGKLGFWVRKLDGKSLKMLSRSKFMWRKTMWKQVTLELIGV